ncbi:hypothetical protein [Hymenobacter jeollabukensis]|uniref:Uncharacterized protein n=1 Tax=Hymenobacter jeollabukensis TaxID=2025313 RepID=A0A5R8WTW6_9BACT|nr:hypothetical protein [Hymenobacter jeollabukensis]TLM95210.1 hypothetical protein FDY95_05325 [Hymenobacter jeollabukensis]
MPDSSLVVTVPQPCHENWEQMTSAGRGRHCLACRKVVVDFTRMSDAELLRWFSHATDNACGRFRPNQLDRPLITPPRLLPRWYHWLVAGAVVWATLTPTAAAAQRPIWPDQHLRPLFVRLQAPRVAAAPLAEATETQFDAPIRYAQPLPMPIIMGGAVTGVRITVLAEPQRLPLLQLEDWLR